MKGDLDKETQALVEKLTEKKLRRQDSKSINLGMQSFLKSIDVLELINRIKKFRALNFQQLSEEDVFKAIINVLYWEENPIEPVYTVAYPCKTRFFRVRKLNGNIILDENLKSVSDFWEPPKECVKKPGRLNKEGESLLYVVPGEPQVAIKEMRMREGEYYALIEYIAKASIKVNIIGGDLDCKLFGINDEHAIMVHEIINNFLRDEFSRDVGEGTEYLYKISETIAKSLYDLPPREVQDAWAYSSVQDKTKYNVCFRPEIAHDMLELQGALICQKGKSEDIQVHCVALYEKEENEVKYYEIGSEKQKKIFPEIITTNVGIK